MALVICPDCGKEQDNANRFCRNCGADLSNVEAIVEKEEISSDSAGEDVLVLEESISDDEESSIDGAVNKCPKCGAKLYLGGKFCPECGVNLESVSNSTPSRTDEKNKVASNKMTAPNNKSPILSAILSFIFPGIGQIYIGQSTKGGTFIILAVVSIALTLLLIGFLLYVLFCLWAIFDAYSSAVKLNNGEYVEDTLF